VGAAAGLGTVVVVRVVAGEHDALVVAVAASAVAAASRLAAALFGASDSPSNRHGGERAARPWSWVLNGVIAVLALGLLAWTGGNDPRLQWFGPVAYHGPRQQGQVAITFDDGPNATATLAVRDILDRYGVKATFFLVGRALDERPDLARALLDDGQLLGNHSYHHDQWRWLDPRYPELERTQQAFARNLGVCPRFYRPPHGERTPFITAQVDHKGMRMVTWDVSAGDWATTNGALVAQRVLDRVQPGSIVLLHDGLDGRVNVDRSVIVDALPRILDGLRAKGLTPVRLDVLLGGPGYLTTC
jgi:peptidoglycan/xylan/chitin deacetylase (PgdA/CDA1 family)